MRFGFLPPPNVDFYKVTYGKNEADEILAELSRDLKPNVDPKKPDPELCSRALVIVRPVSYLVKAERHKPEQEVRLIETREGWLEDIKDRCDEAG